jgi:hypothetical protein
MIYFLYDPVSFAIKVGYTSGSDGRSRLGGNQTGNPNKIIYLGCIEGELEEEKEIHERFKEFKTEGGSEWFYAKTQVIREVVRMLEMDTATSIDVFVYSIAHLKKMFSQHFIEHVLNVSLREMGRYGYHIKKYYLYGDSRGIHTTYYVNADHFIEGYNKFIANKTCESTTIWR